MFSNRGVEACADENGMSLFVSRLYPVRHVFAKGGSVEMCPGVFSSRSQGVIVAYNDGAFIQDGFPMKNVGNDATWKKIVE
jgi:hypothetical protein